MGLSEAMPIRTIQESMGFVESTATASRFTRGRSMLRPYTDL